MDITLEQVEQVTKRTGVSYKRAKEALEAADGSVVDAIIIIEQADDQKANETVSKLKRIVKQGNITKITMKRKDKVLLTVPLNVGVIGGILGIAVAPWGVIAGIIAAYGFDCKIELEKADGTTVDMDDTNEAD